MPVQVPTPDELAQVDTRARAAQDAAATAQNTATDALAGSARATAATSALAAEVAALTARVAKLEQPTTPPPVTPEVAVAGLILVPSRARWPLMRSGPHLVPLRSSSMRSEISSLVMFGDRAGRDDLSSRPSSPSSS